MSTNSECMFIEIKPAQWWYVLENTDAPKNAWDWREYATATGPFGTEEIARTHLHRYHANPGSSYTVEYDPTYVPDDVMKRLLEEGATRKADLVRVAHRRF